MLARLIAARGVRRYGMFFVTGEGTFFPNGVEESSGFVVDQQGQVFSFWTGWDSSRREVTFSQWKLVDPEVDWLDDDEYRKARKHAGLG